MTPTITPEERKKQVGLFRRKAEKVRAKGMSCSVDGPMMRAVLAEIDALRDDVAALDPSDTSASERHEAELAAVCADHRTELQLVVAERDRAFAERDAAANVAAAAVEAAKTGEQPAKQRAPRTKEEPWKSIVVAADSILRDADDRFSHLWGGPLADALVEYGEQTETDVRSWTRALLSVVPEPASSNGNH